MTEISNNLKEKLHHLIRKTVLEVKEPDLGFFSDNNANKKTTKSQKTEKGSTENVRHHQDQGQKLFDNIYYNDVTEDDIFNRNFVFDMQVLLTKNLNPFSIKRKVQDQRNQGMIYMLRDKCVPLPFYRYICGNANFAYLNGKNALHPQTSKIVWKFIEENIENYKLLRSFLHRNKSVFQ